MHIAIVLKYHAIANYRPIVISYSLLYSCVLNISMQRNDYLKQYDILFRYILA